MELPRAAWKERGRSEQAQNPSPPSPFRDSTTWSGPGGFENQTMSPVDYVAKRMWSQQKTSFLGRIAGSVGSMSPPMSGPWSTGCPVRVNYRLEVSPGTRSCRSTCSSTLQPSAGIPLNSKRASLPCWFRSDYVHTEGGSLGSSISPPLRLSLLDLGRYPSPSGRCPGTIRHALQAGR